MPDHQMIYEEILTQLRSLDERVDQLSNANAVINERLTHHMQVEHKDFDMLIDVIRQGKAAGKVIAALIGLGASLVAGWDWIVNHLTYK